MVDEVQKEAEATVVPRETEVTWTPEVEEQARAANWAPRSQWRGDPDKWQPPDKFLESIERSAPFWKGQNERTKQKLAEVEARQHVTETALHQLVETQSQTLKNALAQQLRTLKIQHAEAISAGETVKAVELSEQIDEARERLRAPAAPVQQQQTNQVDSATMNYYQSEWLPRNSWFNDNPEATQYANALSDKLFREKGYTRIALLEKVEEQMRKDMPALYGQRSAVVEETTRSGSGNGKGYVPTIEEKEVFDMGGIKDMLIGPNKAYKSEADYWKAYQADKRSRT